MSKSIVLRFILLVGSDKSTAGWSLVRFDPSVPFELRSGSTSMSDVSDQLPIMVKDCIGNGVHPFLVGSSC